MMTRLTIFITLVFGLLLTASPGFTEDDADTDWERLFNDNWEQRARAVNNGELTLRESIPPNTYELQSTISIFPHSIEDGWVKVYQCHINLDAVPNLEITYRYQQMRELSVRHSINIERAWVEDKSIQMKNIGKNAKVCIDVEAKIFDEIKPGVFLLKQGPFYRRFLDGYYPMRVVVQIHYPAEQLKFDHLNPPPQPGLSIQPMKDRVSIESTFEGQLRLEFFFSK